MFRKIARLLFGGKEETPDEAKPGEPAEDGWLVVNHQGRTSDHKNRRKNMLKYIHLCAEEGLCGALEQYLYLFVLIELLTLISALGVLWDGSTQYRTSL